MTRARRRKTRDRRGLSPAEQTHLRSGVTAWDEAEQGYAFATVRDGHNPPATRVVTVDKGEARAAWAEYGDTITAGPGLVPWAAIVFDGAPGHSSAYCNLGDPHCGCRYDPQGAA
jgi:hypothetical protein